MSVEMPMGNQCVPGKRYASFAATSKCPQRDQHAAVDVSYVYTPSDNVRKGADSAMFVLIKNITCVVSCVRPCGLCSCVSKILRLAPLIERVEWDPHVM